MRVLRVVPVLLAAGVVVPVAQAPARAQSEPFRFDATAAVAGGYATASNPSVPLGVAVEGTAPEARSRLTSLGEASSLAAGPYAGDTLTGFVFSLPGGLGVNGVRYPLVVTTSAGDEPKDVSAPGFALHAESGTNLAAATGSLGEGASNSISRSRVERTEDGVIASSSSETDGLVVFDKLLIGGVRSSARTAADASTGKLTSDSSFTIGRLTARGLSITVPPSAPVGAGTRVEGPDLGYKDGEFFLVLPVAPAQRIPVDASAVTAAFKAIGVTVTVQEEMKTPNGVVAAGITMGTVIPAPPANPQYNGPTPVSFTLGRAATSVTVNPTDVVPAVDFLLEASEVGSGANDLAPPAPPVEGIDAAGGAAALGDLGGASFAEVPSALPPDLAAPGEQAPAGAVASVANRLALERVDLAALYLMLVAVAIVAFGSANVLRVLGVRYR